MNNKANTVLISILAMALVSFIGLTVYQKSNRTEVETENTKLYSKLATAEDEVWKLQSEKFISGAVDKIPSKPYTWSEPIFSAKTDELKAKRETFKKQKELDDSKKSNERK